MAQTDTRPGFKLPWTADRNDSDHQPVSESGDQTTPTDEPAPVEELETPAMIEPTAAPTTRRPTKFMAELSRAMQVAAETSRDETMARLTAEAKAAVEEIRNGSTVEAAALRRRADDDVAAVREWSKAEIARIREEAEARIALRKTALDGEIDAYGLVVEERVERVAATVAEYEARMASFFERLLAEEDPTRIATMAETMPDAPDLAEVIALIAGPEVVPFDPVPAGVADRALPMPDLETARPVTELEPTADATDDASFALESESDRSAPVEPDFAAAEAEAATFAGALDEDEKPLPDPIEQGQPLPAVPDGHTTSEQASTQVVVVGLVSVASIASFKRSLGRAPGVSSISVASGPDGEFVFTVGHDSEGSLADSITSLPGFGARITSQTDDRIEITAHDPDAGA
jgi:hypothetical protein